jgi:subtilisin family serine protease
MKRLGIGIFVVSLTFGLTSCSQQRPQVGTGSVAGVGSTENVSGKPITPPLSGKNTPPPTDIEEGKSKAVEISTDLSTLVYKKNGKLFFIAEGVLTPEAFVSIPNDLKTRSTEMEKLTKELKKNKVRVLSADPATGYFKAFVPYQASLFAAIENIDFNLRFVINPIIYDPNTVKNIHLLSKEMNETVDVNFNASNNASYSGLQRIRAPEFVKEVQKELGGIAIDGSSVSVGVTDTGVTYDHPSFLSGQSKKSRVKYMKEFTGEGTLYFNPISKTTITAGTNPDELLVSAEILITPPLPDLPLADALEQVQNLKVKVSEEQKALILANKDKVLFGVLLEKVLSAPDEMVDLNANKKSDDQFPVFFIPGSTPELSQAIVDFGGKGDFRNSGIIGDFNTSGKTVRVRSEKIGLHITKKKLPNSEDGVDEVYAAGIVGFDPGNHGSHVSGIIGGLKTIANDSEETLARGVAPEAQLMVNRVCSNNAGCGASEAMIDLAKNGAEVINMSLGGLSPFNDGYSTQDLLVNRLSQLFNTTFVISAGNSGPGRQTIGSPSVARLSLSVGAAASKSMIRKQYQWSGDGTSEKTDANDDFMLFFSSRGPTAAGGFKPSLAAPGTELSAVQLNAPVGAQGGLSVYWGTSMSAPTTAGAYALLLDAVKKYNEKFPAKKLPQDAATLKDVLIQSARPFDVTRFDPSTGEKSTGQYSWTDQGLGMLDLVAAWKKLAQVRDEKLALGENDISFPLDYQVITSQTSPYGVKYDGSRANPKGEAVFGTGIYLTASETSTLVPVYIARKLPLNLAASDDGSLIKQLQTTAQEFTLKTVYYGSDKEWLKVGVRNQTDCLDSETSPLTVIGTGAEIAYEPSGAAKLVPSNASTLNVCVDRLKVRNELTPGDHGALIFAYATRGGKQDPLPSFIVPVYVNVPHRTLEAATGYEVKKTIKSFGVDRNYVMVPEGTSLVKVSLEVEKPDAVLDLNGRPASYKNCSGVELMSLEGVNTAKSFPTRAEARVKSCDANGSISSEKSMKLAFTRTNPTPGIWDLNVFGSYIYPNSRYRLKVDYITATSSKKTVVGGMDAISGSLDFTIQDSSLPISLEKGLSSYELSGLRNVTIDTINQKQTMISKGPLGELRKYPEGVLGVIIQTAGAPGSDIDLAVIECAEGSKDVTDPSCLPKGQSGGATDEERVPFLPRKGYVYAVRVDGYDIKNGTTKFSVLESLLMDSESGNVSVFGTTGKFKVDYGFNSELIAKSVILNSPLFQSKVYSAQGAITLRSDDESVLGAVPVEIKH